MATAEEERWCWPAQAGGGLGVGAAWGDGGCVRPIGGQVAGGVLLEAALHRLLACLFPHLRT